VLSINPTHANGNIVMNPIDAMIKTIAPLPAMLAPSGSKSLNKATGTTRILIGYDADTDFKSTLNHLSASL
jgi:hypothetical protein